ncbi:MAG: helix-turn-helix domain-containing protein, partial [Eubacterium sp.]|nr:helix-turn-helix domain-containing protein [Eubacterium sp.]
IICVSLIIVPSHFKFLSKSLIIACTTISPCLIVALFYCTFNQLWKEPFFCLQKEERFTEKKYKQLEVICKEAGIYAGISNNFESLIALNKYYKQALRAIELGAGDNLGPGLYIYADYYLRHMTNVFLQKECSETYCHPKLKVLFNYDRSNKTQLAYTLYMYLVNERNIATTSKAMFVHRNTIIYRLQKIDEMVDIMYDDYQERQYLILSYELYKGKIILKY